MAKWGEIKCPSCEALEAKLAQQDDDDFHPASAGDDPIWIGSVEYITKSRSDDLVQAAVAAKLREAAESLHTAVERKGSSDYRRCHQGYSNGIDACYDATLALITPDAQAALDRYVKARQSETDLLRKRLKERFDVLHGGGE